MDRRDPGAFPGPQLSRLLAPPEQGPLARALDGLARAAKATGRKVWLVGGTVRDLLLGRTPPDYDLAVSQDACGLAENLARQAGYRYVPLKKELDSCRLVYAGGYLDLTGLRAPDLEGDLKARDFTVNALALSLDDFLKGNPAIIDPTYGMPDMAERRLAAAGPGVLQDDPLRVLRAFRFMSSHALIPTPGLMDRLKKRAPGLAKMPKERISHEWRQLMNGAMAYEAIKAMDDARVLTLLAPELEHGRGVTQNPFHHLDVLGHNLAALKALGEMLNQPDASGAMAPEAPVYAENPARRALIMTAALFHDLGKPMTRKEKQGDWASFHNHDRLGASLALKTCQSLGLSKAESACVSHLVGEHMRPFHLMGVMRQGGLSQRAVRRMLVSAGEDLGGIFLLALADTIAGKGPLRPEDAEEKLFDLYRIVMKLKREKLAQALAAPPLLNGGDVMKSLGIPPGPQVGKILKLVREAQLEGEIRNKDQALAMINALKTESSGPGQG